MKLDECSYRLNPERSIHTGTPTSVFLARVSGKSILGNRFAASAVCSHPEILQNPSQLMLLGSKIHTQGNVMAINNQSYFGPICSSGVSTKTVSSSNSFFIYNPIILQKKVICAQLGYVGINKLGKSDDFSDISLVPAGIESMECDGTESTIAECKITSRLVGCKSFATVSCGGSKYPVNINCITT